MATILIQLIKYPSPLSFCNKHYIKLNHLDNITLWLISMDVVHHRTKNAVVSSFVTPVFTFHTESVKAEKLLNINTVKMPEMILIVFLAHNCRP